MPNWKNTIALSVYYKGLILTYLLAKKNEYNVSASEMLQIEINGSYSKFPNDIALV